jgi:charged multivesicular body protein 7
LSPVDVGLVELKDAVAGLQLQIDGLHAQIDSHRDRAAEAVRAKRLPDVALSHLRARKRLEEVLRKRLGTLDNLHSTMLSIEGAAADIGIMKNYETSASTLKAILSHPALQREHIDETLDALASANADAREVDDAIRLGGQVNMEEAGGVFDEDEIERELAQLAKESEREQETKVVSKLPSVPVTPPVSQETGRQRMWDRITEAS